MIPDLDYVKLLLQYLLTLEFKLKIYVQNKNKYYYTADRLSKKSLKGNKKHHHPAML